MTPGPLSFYPEATDSYTVAHLETSEIPGNLDSDETRHVEFEVRGELPDTIQGQRLLLRLRGCKRAVSLS